MIAEILPDGRLLIPIRAENEDGTILGDGATIIDQSHPDFQSWMTWIERTKSESTQVDESDSSQEEEEGA